MLRQCEFQLFEVEFNVLTLKGRYQHQFIRELGGEFEAIVSPSADADDFFQYELDNWDGLCYVPDEVIAVLISWQIWVSADASL